MKHNIQPVQECRNLRLMTLHSQYLFSFKENPNISLKQHTIGVNPSDFENNGYASEGLGRKGPLSWFVNGCGSNSEIRGESEAFQFGTGSPPQSTFVKGIGINSTTEGSSCEYRGRSDVRRFMSRQS